MAVDLTKFSTADLQALQAGDLSKVSTPALLAFQGKGPLDSYGAGDAALDTGRILLSGVTHMVAPVAAGVAGLAGSIIPGANGDKWHDAVQNAVTYNTPEGSSARAATDQMTRFVGGTPGLAQAGHGIQVADKAVDDFVGKYGGPDAQEALRQVSRKAGYITDALPAAQMVREGVMATRAARAAAEANAAAARTPDEIARAAGLRISPSTQEAMTGATPVSTTAKVGEAVGGSSKRENVLHNKPVINSTIAESAGVAPDTHPAMIREGLQAAEAPHAAVYRQVEAALPDEVPFDAEFRADVGRAGVRENDLRPDPKAIETERNNALQMTGGNGAQLRETIARYREEGYKNLGSESDAQWSKGAAQLDIANALEAQMQRALERAGQEGLAFDYQRARQGFAKINTARESLNGNDFDLKKLARLADKNPGIDGPMKMMADLHRLAPDEITTRVPAGGGQWLGHGIASSALGSLGWAAGHALGGPAGGAIGGAAGLTAGPLLRKGVRSIVNATRGEASEPGQALAFALANRTRPPSVRPTPPAPPNLTLSEPTAPPRSAPANSDLAAVMAGDLRLGEHQPPGLSLGEYRPAPAPPDFSRSEAERLAGDLAMMPGGAERGSEQAVRDLARVMAEGVPEGTVQRTPRPHRSRPARDELPFTPPQFNLKHRKR